MPELPEVETIRQDLRKKINGHRFTKVDVLREKTVLGTNFPLFKLIGDTVKDIERIGKLIMIRLVSERYILVHLKMTGQLIYARGKELLSGGHSFPHLKNSLPDKHTKIIFNFDDGGVLYFNDQRCFGYIRLVNKKDKELVESAYGLEPLRSSTTFDKFSGVLQNKKSVIKSVLLDQKNFAGIGNIYADEICHAAKILPYRKADSLTEVEIKTLYKVSKEVLKKAVKNRGTSFSDYVDGDGRKGNFVPYLKVYNRAGEKCKTCGKAVITRKKVAGRGTCFCLFCQH